MSKVACTSIKSTFLDNEYKELAVHQNSQPVQSFDPAIAQGRFTFSFVRNPYQRLFSLYQNKFLGWQQYDGHFYFANQYFLSTKAPFIKGFKDTDSFDLFIKKNCFISDQSADRHFRSQYWTLYRDGTLMADFIGRFETIQADFNPIAEQYGLKPLPHYNKTGSRLYWEDVYTPELAERVYKRL